LLNSLSSNSKKYFIKLLIRNKHIRYSIKNKKINFISWNNKKIHKNFRFY